MKLELTDDQLAELSLAVAYPASNLPAPRALAVLLVGQGKGSGFVSRATLLHQSSVIKWVHKYRKAGLAGLSGKSHPGRPVSFGADVRKKIEALFAVSPRVVGLDRDKWTLQAMRRYLVEHGTVQTISLSTIHHVLQGVKRAKV